MTDSTARRAWIDPSNGISGDMLLGAVVDVGASLATISDAVEAVIPGTVRLEQREVTRAGMRATKVDVVKIADDLPHRDWPVIRTMIERSSLSTPIKDGALAIFTRLAEAEARAHGIAVEDVHFHEVGSWDSIADIIGVAAGLASLGISSLTAGAVGVGSGSIATAHGQIPIPVPAVLELSHGWPIVTGGAGELATPTGMAVLAALARPGDLPSGLVAALGVGAGGRDDPGRPNVVRLLLFSDAAVATPTEAALLECNVDDLDPRLWPGVLASLIDEGADDAWLTPIIMKKGRPAHTLSVLCPPDAAARLGDRVFELVPTLGLRQSTVGKRVLDRTWRTVSVGGSDVRIKLGLTSGIITSATPEFADIADAAAHQQRPERAVLVDAIAAASASNLIVGQKL